MALIFDPSFTILTEERSWKLFNQILVSSQIFGGLSIILVAVWMGTYGGFAWNEDPEKEFHYHPTFMVMGLVFLYGESLIVYRVFRNERKRFTKLLHVGLHSMFFGVAIFLMVSIAVALGISERSAWKNTCWTKDREWCSEHLASNFLGIFIFLYSACVICLVGNPRWRRKPLPEEEMLQGMSLSSSRDNMD